MADARLCFEDCSTDQTCKQTCVKEARQRYTALQDMTEQMVQVSKQELTAQSAVSPSQKF